MLNVIPSNRLVLKVELINLDKLKLTLVYLDKRFLSNGLDYKYFYKEVGDKNGFHFYSRNKFFIMENCLRFPDSKNYKRGIVAQKTFNSEEQRHVFLKKLYKGLNAWNNEFKDFKSSNEHENRRIKIKFNGEFWIL